MPHYDSPASPADTPVQTGDYVSIHWDDLTIEGTSVKCPPHTARANSSPPPILPASASPRPSRLTVPPHMAGVHRRPPSLAARATARRKPPAGAGQGDLEGFTVEMLFFQLPQVRAAPGSDSHSPCPPRTHTHTHAHRRVCRYLFDSFKRFALFVNQQLASRSVGTRRARLALV